jgi:hypothetical protein
MDNELFEDQLEMALVNRDQIVQAFAANRADFGILNWPSSAV